MNFQNEFFPMRGYTSRQCKLICMNYYKKGQTIKQIAVNHVLNNLKQSASVAKVNDAFQLQYKKEHKKVSDVIARHQLYFYPMPKAKDQTPIQRPLGSKTTGYWHETTEEELFEMQHSKLNIDWRQELRKLTYYQD